MKKSCERCGEMFDEHELLIYNGSEMCQDCIDELDEKKSMKVKK